jgi:uncharacterized protein
MELENSNYKRVSARSVRLWTFQSIITSVFLLTGAVITAYIFELYVIPIVLFAICAALTVVYPKIEYKQLLYSITESNIMICHGVFFVKTSNIPINRIQHVDISCGPVQKIFKLVNVGIYTAGSVHIIKAIDKEDAEKIVEYLNDIIKNEDKIDNEE